jgi:adenylosuccinate synthase
VEQMQADCKKRKLNEQTTVFKAQMMCIQGVSEAIANAICFEYPDFNHLIRSYETMDTTEEKEEMLKDLKTTKKKIGPVLSKRIYHCTVRDNSCHFVKKTAIQKVVKKVTRRTKKVPIKTA